MINSLTKYNLSQNIILLSINSALSGVLFDNTNKVNIGHSIIGSVNLTTPLLLGTLRIVFCLCAYVDII